MTEYNESISDGISGGDSPGILLEFYPTITEGEVAGDTFAELQEFYSAISDGAVGGDSVAAFNLTAILRANPFITRYFIFTLTGTADGADNVTIPIVSFQGRFKSGDPSFLSVVIRGGYKTQVSARTSGQLVVQIQYVGDRKEVLLTEEIARVDLEDITLSDGSNNASITLSGHRTETWGSQIVTIYGEHTKITESGKLRIRSSSVDPYLRPGNTVVSGSDTITVGEVNYIIGQDIQSMEIVEA